MKHTLSASLLSLTMAATAGVAAAAPPGQVSPQARSTTTFVAAAPAPERERWDDRPWMVNVHLALGAPAGNAAIELERSIVPSLSLAVGTGQATGGQQWAGMARWRHTSGGHAIGIGGGLSYGDFEEWMSFWTPPDRIEDVTWSNGEVFWEGRSHTGFHMRAYLGASAIVARGRCIDGGDGDCDPLPDGMPYAGWSLGWAF